MPTCYIHGCELVRAVTPIRYGYPDIDEEKWDLEAENPYHGQYDLGGCVITPDSPPTRKSWVCPVCTENFKAGGRPTRTKRRAVLHGRTRKR